MTTPIEWPLIPRCFRTGNPCGTDTVDPNHPCRCASCVTWRCGFIAGATLERKALAESRAGADTMGVNTGTYADKTGCFQAPPRAERDVAGWLRERGKELRELARNSSDNTGLIYDSMMKRASGCEEAADAWERTHGQPERPSRRLACPHCDHELACLTPNCEYPVAPADVPSRCCPVGNECHIAKSATKPREAELKDGTEKSDG